MRVLDLETKRPLHLGRYVQTSGQTDRFDILLGLECGEFSCLIYWVFSKVNIYYDFPLKNLLLMKKYLNIMEIKKYNINL